MFITLTSALEYPDEPLRININNIMAFHEATYGDTPATRVVLGGTVLYVKETPDQIEALIDNTLKFLSETHWQGRPS